MPIYTVKKDNPKSTKTWEINCKWEELQDVLDEYKLVQVLSAPRIVESVGGALSKTDDGWKENLKRIKKGAGEGNTIKL